MAHRSRRRYLGDTGAAAHVPRSRRTPRTCYRDTGVLDESGAVQGDRVLLTHCRRRRRGWRTRYRGVSRAGAVTVAIAVAIGGADGGACTTAGIGAKHGVKHGVVPVRQQRRQWAGQRCRRPCAGVGAATASGERQRDPGPQSGAGSARARREARARCRRRSATGVRIRRRTAPPPERRRRGPWVLRVRRGSA